MTSQLQLEFPSTSTQTSEKFSKTTKKLDKDAIYSDPHRRPEAKSVRRETMHAGLTETRYLVPVSWGGPEEDPTTRFLDKLANYWQYCMARRAPRSDASSEQHRLWEMDSERCSLIKPCHYQGCPCCSDGRVEHMFSAYDLEDMGAPSNWHRVILWTRSWQPVHVRKAGERLFKRRRIKCFNRTVGFLVPEQTGFTLQFLIRTEHLAQIPEVLKAWKREFKEGAITVHELPRPGVRESVIELRLAAEQNLWLLVGEKLIKPEVAYDVVGRWYAAPKMRKGPSGFSKLEYRLLAQRTLYGPGFRETYYNAELSSSKRATMDPIEDNSAKSIAGLLGSRSENTEEEEVGENNEESSGWGWEAAEDQDRLNAESEKRLKEAQENQKAQEDQETTEKSQEEVETRAFPTLARMVEEGRAVYRWDSLTGKRVCVEFLPGGTVHNIPARYTDRPPRWEDRVRLNREMEQRLHGGPIEDWGAA